MAQICVRFAEGQRWFLARSEKMDAKQFNEMANFHSGLLGVSETSSDMRDLLDRETKDVRAAEAVALFCYQVKKWIGAFAAALGGPASGTLAREIIDSAKKVRIFGEEVSVQAHIYTIGGFSAHADKAELLAWHERAHADRTFLVHGEEKAMQFFSTLINNSRVEMPKLNQTFDL